MTELFKLRHITFSFFCFFNGAKTGLFKAALGGRVEIVNFLHLPQGVPKRPAALFQGGDHLSADLHTSVRLIP